MTDYEVCCKNEKRYPHDEAVGLKGRCAARVFEDFNPVFRKLYDNLTTNEKDFGIARGVPTVWLALLFYPVRLLECCCQALS